MNAWKIENAKNSLGESHEVLISEGVIVQALPAGSKPIVINAEGLYVLPGFVDLHTHLREPGREDAETVLTGSQAAVAGGFTAISAMPNTLPVADTAGVVEQVFRLGKSHGLCDVYPIGAVTIDQRGTHLAELSAMNQSEARVRTFSYGGQRCVGWY